MSDWSNTNVAQSRTWGTLIGPPLKQIDEDFDHSGTIQMQNFAFWNNLESSDERNIQAIALARTINDVFNNDYRATFIAGSDAETTIAAMSGILNAAAKTVNDLADVVEQNYQFPV